jgi:4-hydroxy-3-methylbut-2-enyl diphosphate reductase
MKIEVAPNAGFCGGVKRAIKLVEDSLPDLPQPVRMYGNLVHNEQVMDRLKAKGVEVVSGEIGCLREGSLIFTAHGTPDYLKALAKANGLRVLDTVCPKVTYMRELIRKLLDRGYVVLVLGDKKHPEIRSIPGFGSKSVKVCPNLDGFTDLDLDTGIKYALFSQTTSNHKEYADICRQIQKRLDQLEVYDTICPATYTRQEEAKEMAKKHEIIIVAGSHTSANTNRLYQVAKRINSNTYFVQTAEDLDTAKFSGAESIGLTAGASTPDWVIHGILDRFKELESEL